MHVTAEIAKRILRKQTKTINVVPKREQRQGRSHKETQQTDQTASTEKRKRAEQ